MKKRVAATNEHTPAKANSGLLFAKDAARFADPATMKIHPVSCKIE